MIRKLILGVGALVALAFLALPLRAQSVSWPTMTGNQCWSAGAGISGQSAWFCTQLIIDYFTANPSGLQPVQTVTGTGTVATTAKVGTTVWTGTAPTAWNITLPAGPANGSVVRVTSATTLTSIVGIAAGSGDTISGGAVTTGTITANTTVLAYQYNSANKTWYKVQ